MSEPFGCLKTGLATPIRMFDDVFDVFIVSSHEAPIAFDDLITIIGHTFFPQDALLCMDGQDHFGSRGQTSLVIVQYQRF